MDVEKTKNNINRVSFNAKHYCNKKSLADCDTYRCLLRAENANEECINYMLRRIRNKLNDLIGEEV